LHRTDFCNVNPDINIIRYYPGLRAFGVYRPE
jgi:hypothetical protein